ncbi:cache domain-containing sensor histidine kinase [Blautia sp. HCP3S3_G3]|uniref:cache domain-containing sensor histidine kinase n=1 Tax=Blautia sp. HCP3S3_G3 TaxID=3438913 RepID=UPI003F8C1A8C
MMMRRFFLKRFKQFLLVTLIPTLLLSAVFLGFQFRSSIRNMTTESANTLIRVDDNITNVVGSSVYQYELLTYNPRLALSLKKFFQHDDFTYSDVVLLNSLRVLLGSVAQAHDYISSIYLYLDGFDDFFSTTKGFQSIAGFSDQDWFPVYQQMDNQKRFWITNRTFKEYSYIPPTQYITVFQRMSNISGVIVLNIDISDFTRTLNNSTSINQEYLYILNEDMQILSSNDSGAQKSQLFQNYLIQHAVQNGTLSNLSNTWISMNGHRYYLEVRNNYDYGISYCALTPASLIVSQQYFTLFILLSIFLCYCMIMLFLSYRITKRNFQKISDIIQVFDNAEKGTLPEWHTPLVADEYDVILDNVIQVFLKSTYLQRELTEKQYQQQLAEKTALQLQINPHFLFNTLQTLDFQALKITGHPGTMNRTIQNLSDILKYSLQDPSTMVTLQDELIYLKKYIEIQKQRYGNQFIIYFEIQEDLPGFSIPRLLLQPLVENSISHGIAALNRTGYIKVRIYQHKELIHFAVIDNGIGLGKDEIQHLYELINSEKSKNIGLTNVNRRLILQYGSKYALHIQSKKGLCTRISFSLPLKS